MTAVNLGREFLVPPGLSIGVPFPLFFFRESHSVLLSLLILCWRELWSI
jgi:hypothetical protein